MTVTFQIEDVRTEVQDAKEETITELKEYMKTIALLQTEDRYKSTSKILSAIFSESKKIRKEIGYQTIMLKVLEDNLNEIRFDEDTGVSSKIEVSVGTEVFGSGAKWVMNIDTGKVDYDDMFSAMQFVPGIKTKIKNFVKSKI